MQSGLGKRSICRNGLHDTVCVLRIIALLIAMGTAIEAYDQAPRFARMHKDVPFSEGLGDTSLNSKPSERHVDETTRFRQSGNYAKRAQA